MAEFSDGKLSYSNYDPDDETPVAARRADALSNIAETYLNHPDNSGSTADRNQVVVHVRDDSSTEDAHLGRRSRTIPAAMRRALKARDGGCRFPGCTNHKFVDGHHIRHWSDGGETSLDNLVLLCRHQRLKEFQQTVRIPVEETLGWMYRKFANHDVTAETSTAKWLAGEEMDMEHAVWLMSNAKAYDQRDGERPESVL